MANHVSNKLTANAETIDRLISVNNNGDLLFDFGIVVPTPEALFQGSISSKVEGAAKIALGLIDFNYKHPSNLVDLFRVGDYGVAASSLENMNLMRQLAEGPYPKDFGEEEFNDFILILKSYRATGHLFWYTWNIQYWGTKWNAYAVTRSSNTELIFETAWSAPHPVIETLAKSVDVVHEWADEDTGHNVGRRIYRFGNFQETLLDNTKEGYELAFEFKPWQAECYELVKNEYVYKEED
jgi:Ferredoxin-like domain in Api92-like protein